MGVILRQDERNRKTRSRSLAAASALVLVVCGFYIQRAAAQSATSSASQTQKKAASTKAVNPAATSATSSRASGAKNHTATPASANKKSRSSTAVSHNSKTKPAISRTGSTKSGGKKASRKKTVARGQQKIDPERAQAIQEALIREHYLSADAAGTWNQASEDAMRKYQADHGWQSKTVPDSRALISLGLGPSHDHLLNPESAMTTGPDTSHAASVSSSTQSPVSHSADPGESMGRKLPSDSPPATTPERNPSSPE